MKHYSGFEWLLIDVANQAGKDKLLFEERIQWTKDHIDVLEQYGQDKEWKEKPLYLKAVIALRDVQKGKTTGHMIGVDASASGIQCMSALSGCIKGAEITGLIDPNKRADVYTEATNVINQMLGTNHVIERDRMKQSIMCSFYGSKAMPKALFGEDTPELEAFYKVMGAIAPGAWELLQDLLNAWQKYAKAHCWTMPDGFEVKVKVMTQKECRVEIDEMDHAQLVYTYYENEGAKRGLSLVANVAHATDSLIVREMHRRVNHDKKIVVKAMYAIEKALEVVGISSTANGTVTRYKALYEASGFASAVVLPYMEQYAKCLEKDHLKKLYAVCLNILKYDPMPLVTIHDAFSTLPNGVNAVRFHYKEIMAEIAEARILDNVFTQILGQSVGYQKLGNISENIRKSEYALC